MPRILFLGAIAIFLSLPTVSHAKAERTVGHAFTRVWPTALRSLRVDEGFAIVEKDVDAGYIVFEVKEEQRTFRGAMEFIRVMDSNDTPQVRLVVRIADRPVYSEAGILDRLLQKLHDEYGDPPPPREKSKDDTPSEKSRLQV